MNGNGADRRVFGMPVHNPEPSTPRGRRRHANRTDEQKKQSAAAWNKARSTRKSRFQIELETNVRPKGKNNG